MNNRVPAKHARGNGVVRGHYRTRDVHHVDNDGGIPGLPVHMGTGKEAPLVPLAPVNVAHLAIPNHNPRVRQYRTPRQRPEDVQPDIATRILTFYDCAPPMLPTLRLTHTGVAPIVPTFFDTDDDDGEGEGEGEPRTWSTFIRFLTCSR